MPATRSATRHGSRQPHAHNHAGPSHHTTIAISDGEGPPRKRHAAGGMSAKARSKQKARSVLPPAAEIIEISSDDEPPAPKKSRTSGINAMERKMKELEEENKRLRAAVATSPSAPPTQVQGPPATAGNDQLLSALEDHVSCEVCTLKMWNPYTLACGHTFCKTCLQDWFNTALVQHLATHPHYDASRLIPPHLRTALAHPQLPKETRFEVESQISRILSSVQHPQYSCPTCRIIIKAKPAENFVVKHLVRTIAAVQGDSCPNEAPKRHHPGRPMDGPFDGYFP